MYVNLRFCLRAISLFASMPEFQRTVLYSETGSFLPIVVREFSMYQPPGPWKPWDQICTQGKPSSPSTAGVSRKRITAYPLPAASTSGCQKRSSALLEPPPPAEDCSTAFFNLSRDEPFFRFDKLICILRIALYKLYFAYPLSSLPYYYIVFC